MSYILEALKKLERERHLERLPSLDTEHNLPIKSRRWVWLGTAGAILLAVPLILWLRPGILEGARQEAAGTLSTGETKTAPEGPQALQPKDHPHAAAETSPPAGSRLEGREPPKAARTSPTRAERAPKIAKSAKERIPGSRLEEIEASARFEPKASQAPGPAVIEETPEPRVSQSRLPEEPIASGEVGAPALSQTPLPNLQQLPAEIRGSMPEMRISLLAYTSNAADRMVYINGTKYQEGQMVEGKAKVEAIIPEGAILSIQGHRFLLGP